MEHDTRNRSTRYVRIPYGSRLEFPAVCPFTGDVNPRSTVAVSRHETQMILPIPFVGLFRLGKRGTVMFPAAKRISFVATILAPLPVISVLGGIISLIWTADGPYAWRYFLGGFAGMYLFLGLKWFWLRRVRIVRIGMSSVEVRFASQSYAKEFCTRNDLHCGKSPASKRQAPVLVNHTG